MPTIAEALRSYRLAHNLSRNKLYLLTGVLPQVIHYIEKGRGSPHLVTVKKLLDAGVLPPNLEGITFPHRKSRLSSLLAPPVEPVSVP